LTLGVLLKCDTPHSFDGLLRLYLTDSQNSV
jgi:hypothetical protein